MLVGNFAYPLCFRGSQMFVNSFNNMITSIAPKSLETRIRVASIQKGLIDLRVYKQFQNFVNRYVRREL